ncbi:MAG TPA: hypothetical protein PLD47_18075 [Aggregatilineales bacterium]|mgnify:CR=1 FL=1|nr:hypothetical protein [Anaerolineales bacterium]HRE49637.1 hypothetical protein [Aggregatilineales bacterium]
MTEAVGNSPEAAAPSAVRPNRFLRTLLILLAAGVVVAILANLILNGQRGARNSPLSYEEFPGAVKLEEFKAQGEDRTIYETKATVNQVFEFYGTRLGKEQTSGCKKIYTTDPPDAETPGKSFARCVIDNSQDEIAQTLMISITYDLTNERTLIEVVREWGSRGS